MDSTAPIKPRVLFVDDEPRILTTMRMLFRSNYELSFAESGQQALELLKTQPVDVIVSDQRMPGMTGIELLRAARDLNPNAMRILLTGYSDLNAIIGSINEGEIFRFVNKPWSNEELTATVARAVTAARVSMAIAAKPDEPAAPNASTPAVLVLDDDTSVPAKIQAIIGAEYRVFGATSMEQAVGLLEKERIGVVISDTFGLAVAPRAAEGVGDDHADRHAEQLPDARPDGRGGGVRVGGQQDDRAGTGDRKSVV